MVVAGRDAIFRDIARIACSDVADVVDVARTRRQLVAACEREHGMVVVSEDQLADGSLLPTLPAVHHSGGRVVVVCPAQQRSAMVGLLAAGVQGVLFHDAAPRHLADAVQEVAAGGARLHPAVARDVLAEWRALRNVGRSASHLTEREHQVLTAMVEGLSTKATARRLSVAVKTVENHKGRIFGKLGVRSHAHAVSVALGAGLVTVGQRGGGGVDVDG